MAPRLIAFWCPASSVEGQCSQLHSDMLPTLTSSISTRKASRDVILHTSDYIFAHQVYRFFQARHASHYRIINLCSERQYNLDTFHGNVARYPFPDHNPPAMELILPCCAHIHAFLQVTCLLLFPFLHQPSPTCANTNVRARKTVYVTIILR